MTETTRAMLQMVQEECDEDDKSTEFMIQYMQDRCSVDFDTVMEFLHEGCEEVDYCTVCGGEGYIKMTEKICHFCHGTGIKKT